MCGICGRVKADPRETVSEELLRKMNGVIRHRGPDSDGFYLNQNVGLAARRLAILDLETGDQPIANEDESIRLVFNGEIYNFQNLRRELRHAGHRFRTNTDTEVIVHLYEEHGLECLQRMRGMFAFALWDAPGRRLLLARDRAGQKPLYYSVRNGALSFGSELKCLLQDETLPRHVSLEAIHHYLTLQYVPHPLTALEGINKLPPAHALSWKDGEIRIERYWDLPYEPKWTDEPAELRQRLRDAITEAVRLRMISDVPLGAHLSGGMDSSIVVALMSRLSRQRVRTFTIGFEEQAFSEVPHARQIASRFDTDHHEFVVKSGATQLLPKLVRHFDEPFADPAAIPTWHLARMSRRHVTVALNGDGGDESFGGYKRYFADTIADLYRCLPDPVRHELLDRFLMCLPEAMGKPAGTSVLRALRRLPRAADLSRGASIVRWGSYFSELEKQLMYRVPVRNSFACEPTHVLLERTYASAPARQPVDRTLYCDVNNYLPGALLPKVDRTTMAHSLEARSPFLDHKVMELGARLPVSWKVRGRQTKWVLRELFADLVPRELLDREKTGFGVPLGTWFQGPLYDSARDLLLGANSRTGELFRPEVVEQLIEANRRGEADNGKRIWALMVLEEWLRQLPR